MYDEVIEKILESIDEKAILTETYPKFSGEGYRPYKIDTKNFHEIKKSTPNKKIAFVDCGNAEIIGSANFSLNLIRVCYAIYENNKKISAKKFEILAFTQAINQNNEIHYKISFFGTKTPIELEEMSFSSFDNTLMLGITRAEISSVANAIRRFAELNIAKLVAEEKTADIIVLDGNLQSTLTNENKYLNELYESCSKSNVVLSALSKTTSLFTENGNLLSAVLDNMGPLKLWFYHPVVEIKNLNHKAEMFFVKFHDKSKHVFRFEIFNKQKTEAEETINILATNCIDPIFIGYPYGLVEADRIARISNNDKDSLKTMFLVKLRNKNIEKYLSSVNAHEILDRISF
ncbi:MAG: DNA double-strand break repair nuclease NurA [Nanoarchaeota archaeon]|nr:DNA double-strand break repair nuclease NurA [Nanoarchaeota archaeon]